MWVHQGQTQERTATFFGLGFFVFFFVASPFPAPPFFVENSFLFLFLFFRLRVEGLVIDSKNLFMISFH